ncbi:MAG: hypothetical protein ACI3Y2_04290 [Candidatus Egerieousia sp.]
MTIKKHYKVAELIFEVVFDTNDPLSEKMENYEPFECHTLTDTPFFSLTVDTPLTESCPQHENLKNQTVIADFDEPDKRIVFYKPILLADTIRQNGQLASPEEANSGNRVNYDILFTLPGKANQFCLLIARDGFTNGRLITKGAQPVRLFGLNNALMMMFAYAGAQKGVLLQHASVIKRNGKGFLFLGKSGTGKSTHSRLWLNNIDGCELLNDDNPALRENEAGIPYVFGTPWSGKTPCYKNDKAVIGGFVKLSQAPVNKIKKLGTIQSYAAIIPTLSNLRWERSTSDNLNATVNSLISKVPTYALDCLPDADAARVSFEALTGEVCKKISIRNDLLFSDVKILINEGKKVSLKVNGNSMLPFIVGGRDSVTLCKKDTYKKGDIVLAEISKRVFVLHRIVRIDCQPKQESQSKFRNVTLRGDGNSGKKAYEHCRTEDIVARAESVVRNGKEINPYKGFEALKQGTWVFLNPIRRWLMAAYRRTPGLKSNIQHFGKSSATMR